ncbi:hypothetical protein EJ02DRAFT_424628 [Clathrospora elynae]|uniref:Uncharacterized protein n=1 Tax=Clathrospora elynae TaxID=706981 RepID=A0A6A5SHZ3_9PLEO|nr:hypothetical protein EJ02DRAFT_424628 [Clathrospora elynae]
MEAITNLATSAATTASKLIYGEPKADDAVEQTKNNETGGKEPISGEQGKGTTIEPFDQGNAATPLETVDKKTFLDYRTNQIDAVEQTTTNETSGKEPLSEEQGKGTVTEPFDQGNEKSSSSSDHFLKLDPAKNPQSESTGEPKIYSDGNDPSYVGMPIVPLNPDVATSNPAAISSSATESTGITDKIWKDTALDNISRSGAPGAGPTAPEHVTPVVPATTKTTTTATDPVIKTSAPDSVTASSGAYLGSATDKAVHSPLEKGDTPGWTSTGVPADAGSLDTTKPGESKGLVGEKSARKSESGVSPDRGSSPTHDSKMSHLKEKMKNKLHIGSKEK